MRWPWQRRRDHEDTAGAAGEAQASPVPRPRGQWRDVEPLLPAGATQLSAAEPLGFVRTLSTRWQVPPALEPLGHEVSITAPAGHVPVAGAPVTGYPDPPELVWAAVPEVPADDVPDARWRRPPSSADHRTAAPAPVVLARPDVLVEPVPATRSVPADNPEHAVAETSVRDLVGDQDPLPLRRSRHPEAESAPAATPAAAASSDADGSTDLSVRRGVPVAPAVVEDAVPRAGAQQLSLPAAARARPVDEAVAAPEPEPSRAAVIEETGPAASGSPVRPQAPAGSPLAVRAEPVGVARASDVRALVSRRRALAEPSSLRAAAEQPEAATDALPVAEPEPLSSYGQPAAPGLGVPDWFSSGPVRPATPEPDRVPGAVQRPAAPGAAPPVQRRTVEHLAGPSAVADRATDPAPDLPPVRGPRRVAWPLDAPADPASLDDEPEEPDGTTADEDVDEVPGTAETDVSRQVAARAEQVEVLASPVARRAVEQDSWVPDPRTSRSEPDRTPTRPRRFRVGAPMPRPASARPLPAPSGLAAFAAASLAAAGADDGAASWEPDRGRSGVEDEVPDVGTLRARLLPSDLGLPGMGEAAPVAPTPATEHVVDDPDDPDDDPAPSADEIYEQVRARLRQELMVDRERAALLVD